MKRVLSALAALCLCASVTYGQGGNFGNPQASLVHLSSNASATGQAQVWQGGIGVFSCVGFWAGATATLQFQGPDGATWVTAGNATTLTANGGGVFYLYSTNIQVAITNAGTGTSITCSAGVVPMPNTA